jgi:hypothetical protein
VIRLPGLDHEAGARAPDLKEHAVNVVDGGIPLDPYRRLCLAIVAIDDDARGGEIEDPLRRRQRDDERPI